MRSCRRIAAGVLAAWAAIQPAYPDQRVDAAGGPDPALLQIRLIEGEGAVHTVGTRASQALILRVTDESGRPVPGASVSLRLPDEGPTGVFATGLRTEVALTGLDGRLVIGGIVWNRVAGPLQLRITASKGEARSGMVSQQYLTEPASGSPRRARELGAPILPSSRPGGSRSRWVLLGLLVGGAAAGAVLAAGAGGGSAAAATAPPVITQPTVSIGPPTITIGKP